MSEETKRLLKYDLLCALKDILIFVLIVLGVQLWCHYMYKRMANMVFLADFAIGMPLFAWGGKDWLVQIRLYVSTGITRKRIFRVLIMRKLLVILAGIFIEAAMIFINYPEIGIKFMAVSGFFLLFVWGFGDIAGVLVYQRKKLGQIFLIIGYMMIGMLSAGSFFSENQVGFWVVFLAEITPETIAVIGVLAVAVFAGGICFAKKQIRNYMVY